MQARTDYKAFLPMQTRWNDNDVYGHVNNVVFYSYFDSAANRFMIEEGGLDPHTSQQIALVVESQCHYHAPISYPDTLDIGISVSKLSNRSVIWAIGVFKQGAAEACAHGRFVHVFVDRTSRRPVEIPEPLRAALARLL